MKVFVACELPEAALEQLRSLAVEVLHRPHATAADLRDGLADVGVLVVDHARVSRDVIARASSLQMIVRAGSGPGEIAVDDASARGVFVTHCPDTQAAAVAELAFGLILALDRRIVENTLALREGRWDRAEFGRARGLAGQTLGILGFGSVGRLVARRAQAFDMHVLAWSPRGTLEGDPDGHVEPCDWPRELARRSDVVTVHDIEGEFEPLVDGEFLQNMPEQACLIHVGSPGAVDEAALAEAIEQRGLRVALDVFSSEPAADSGRFRPRLLECPGVIATHHIGPLTAQARRATANAVVHIVHSFVVAGEVLNCLNLTERSPATWQLVIRLHDQPGALAAILDVVRADGINAQEVTNKVFTGARAAWCTVALDERPSTDALDAIRALPQVMHLELRAVV